MAPSKGPSPTVITIFGRLSFPVFDYKTAVVRNAASPNPAKDPSEVAPEFNLLVESAQLTRLVKHVRDIFLPFCLEQDAKKEKRNALDQASVARLLKLVDSEDWGDQPPYIPIKPVPDMTAPLAPEAVAMIKVKGNRGVDIEQKAIVNDESELLVPDPNQLVFPVIKPIGLTIHQLYPGCIAAATLNLYSFKNGKLPGFSASAGTIVFKADADRFGGGVDIDEDAIFADD